jgi:uncharacterized protein
MPGLRNYCPGRGIRPLGLILAGLAFLFASSPLHAKDREDSKSEAASAKDKEGTKSETRRAFIVGVQRYGDGYIQQLSRTINDARDLGKDLEEVGFDKKNIKVVTDVKNKDAFDKEFNAFLKTIEPGDTVLFFFSGHGFGIEADQTNYLLLGDLKSPFSYVRSQMPEKERKNADVIRLRIPSYLDAYQQNEIAKNGVSAREIEKRIAERNPKTVFLVLDACRSLVSGTAADTNDPKRARRGEDSGSRLITPKTLPGFVVLYSASFGEQAVESFGPGDRRRNSLFTEVLRSELQRPGQSLNELAERVKLMVSAIAVNEGQQQEPEIVANLANSDDVFLVNSIGRERFQLTQDKCTGSEDDWKQIEKLHSRELLERHRRRFDTCRTAELARRALADLALSPEEPPPLASPPVERSSVNECDRLAASEFDPARPPEVRGVPLERMDAESAVAACQKAVQENSRTVRFLFNLGRAYQQVAARPGIDDTARNGALRSARLAYDDAAKRGYISALNNLAVLYENGFGVEANEQEAANLFKRAAQQGHPLAMYNLSVRYRYGTNSAIPRDFPQAYEWAAKAAETGFVPAMIELGTALEFGRGLVRSNPRRAIEWYQRAADAGSERAKFELGVTYLFGRAERGVNADGSNSVPRDPTLALLWLGRISANNSAAQALLAQAMEGGFGLPNPQPEIAERYWRMAAHGGSRFAEVEFAEKMRQGFVIVKQEFGENEGLTLLRRAMSQGSPRAALALAQIYRKGELGQEKKPIEAMKLAYRTIELATQADPTEEEGNPFHEIAAGHLLVEMAKNGEAVDGAGQPLLTQDEVDRLERFYGTVDVNTKQVRIRRLNVRVGCWGGWYRTKDIWVWDWGRVESPTESQFRNIERETACNDNGLLRRTLIDVFEQAKKNKVPFADLIDQKIKTAKLAPDDSGKSRRRRR